MASIKFNEISGNKLKHARIKSGHDQETVASIVALTRSSIINAERGRHLLSPEALLKLSVLYKCSLIDLYPSASDMEFTEDLILKDRLVVQKQKAERKLEAYKKKISDLEAQIAIDHTK